MIIGVLTLEFRLHGNDSLKGKRQVAQSLKQKLRNTFNVAVSEVDAQDAHQKLVLAVVTVSGETTKVESRLSKALAMVEAISPAELVRADTEVFSSAGEIE
ncbi:MAG TPA: DUF503 domain-containing protein [Humidesulfovibrio sp.]|uniref:DUF503 domain-containing protein n=1 Tax=Humidesulfovibrio sp. TaxID=2910988 RepID=UPI002C1B5A05|nr:DUF503 domain-containing protein [Humidesulfovibrio sp.]HWR04451.1 DUF503 domain-containing protein [Humidesulfovibrio sp.]